MKVKNDHQCKFSNLSNREEEAWKNQGFNWIPTRDLRDTGAMLYQLSYEAARWERGQYLSWGVKWCEVCEIIYIYFFQASSFQLLKLKNVLLWSFLIVSPRLRAASAC